MSRDRAPETPTEPYRTVGSAPVGVRRLLWLGPGFLWMLSAAGSGELLFTPRVAALYGYALLWALIVAVGLKWFINREVGRFTVCTGATILEGFARLPGPRLWALWLILIPQIVVAVATTAGLAGAAASAVVFVLGGPGWAWTAGIIIIGVAALVLGGYAVMEKLAALLGIVLSAAVLAAAISVFPDASVLARGLVPQLPPDLQLGHILPWLGFMLAGAAGLMWFSYWIDASGYGAATTRADAALDHGERRSRLRSWVSLMTVTNTLGVVGALVMAFAFLVLGGELLRPQGLVPEADQIAATLGRLLGGVWGPLGFWFMIAAIFVTFFSTTIAVQDGFSRMFADGVAIIGRRHGARGRWIDRRWLERVFTMVLLGAAPIAAYVLAGGTPIGLLTTAGAIEAAHIPVVAVLTIYSNRRMLEPELQPSRVALIATLVAAAFFGVFALLYPLQLAGLLG